MDRDEARALYASLGFVTIPLRPRDKRPLRRGWRAGLDEHWLDAPGNANVGILTGAPSGGLVVLDFDTPEGPLDLLGMTAEQLSVVTMVVRTARGYHVYARAQGRATRTLREGVDLRAEGAMVVAPPSAHPSGARYRFVGTCRSVIALDALLLTREEERAPSVELDALEEWISLQAPKLQEAWRRLRGPPSFSFDASRADFAVARFRRQRSRAPRSRFSACWQLCRLGKHPRCCPYRVGDSSRIRPNAFDARP